MYFRAQGLAHLPAADVGDGVQSEAVEQLIVIQQVFSNAVDDEMKQLMLFVQEQGHGEVADLFLRILVRRDQVDRFKVTEIDVPSQNIDIKQLEIFPRLDSRIW